MPNYWALFANPGIYRIDDAVRDLEVDNWTTKGSRLTIGDRVIIWRGRGSGRWRSDPGVVAFAEVESEPHEQADADNPYWVDRDRAAVAEPRVQVRYVVSHRLPLLLDGPAGSVLSTLTIASGSQRTVFRVTPEQWAAVLDAAGGWPAELTLQPEDELARGRQGALSKAIVRLAVEMHAMDLAIKHYEKEGWRVDDVSARASFDLLCTVDDRESELHVEVKGTTSAGETVRLTRNEVKHATDGVSPVSLFVVADINVEHVGSEVTATGGTVRIFEPWNLDRVHLEPTQYDYRVPAAEST